MRTPRKAGLSRRDIIAATIAAETATLLGIGRASAAQPAGSADAALGRFPGVHIVTDSGAKGDGRTDDTRAINAAFEFSNENGRVVYFPPGTYLISYKFDFLVPFFGTNSNLVTIKAHPTFSAPYMIDFNAGKEYKFINGIRFDAARVPGVKIFGSSSAGGAGGSSIADFHNLYFTNTNADVYAVGGRSRRSESGMLTGSTFRNCSWRDCPSMIHVGRSQDNVTFLGCRFHMPRRRRPKTYIWDIGDGTNTKFINCFLGRVGDTDLNIGGMRPLIRLGDKVCQIECLHIESRGEANLTHVFHAVRPQIHFSLRGINFNLRAPAAVALVRYALSAKSVPGFISVGQIKTSHGHNPFAKLLDLEMQAGLTDDARQNVLLEIDDVDDFDALPIVFTGRSYREHYGVFVRGFHKGSALSAAYSSSLAARPGGGAKQAPGRRTENRTAPRAAPVTHNFDLPGPGTWLVNIVARVEDSAADTAMGTWIVYYGADRAEGVLASDQIGASKFCGRSAIGPNLLELGRPAANGAVKVRVGWSDGLRHSVRLITQTQRLS